MNANDDSQQPTETPFVKRGRGRPRGSTSKRLWIGEKSKGTPIDMRQFRATLPPMPGLSDEEFIEDLRKITKNMSFRLNPKNVKELGMAKWLIYFDRQVGIPRAAMVKECLLKYMNLIFAEKAGQAGVAGHFFSVPSSEPERPVASPRASSEPPLVIGKSY